MTEIKRELQNILEGEQRFSNRNKQAVMDRFHKQKKKSKKVYIVTAVFFALLTLVLFTGFWGENQRLQAAFNHYFENKMENKSYEVLYKQFDYLQKDDALVAFIEYEEAREVIYLAYFQYENGWQWKQTTGTQSSPYENTSKYLWGSTVQAPYMYAGVIASDELDRVLVGQTKAQTIVLSNGLTYWFAVSENAARIAVHYTTGQWERLIQSSTPERDKEQRIPFIDTLSPTQYMIDLKVDTMDRGNKDYYEYPIVIEPIQENVQRGDIVTYINKNGEQTISRVLGLPEETVEIKNGSVLTNTVHLAHDYFFSKIMGEAVFEQYLEKMTGFHINEAQAKTIFYMNFPETKLAAHELFVVPDNWARGTSEIISLDQLRGKVAGYTQQSFDMLWSDEERALYTQFKKTNDPALFRTVDPITYVRTQLYAQYVMDQQTNFRMYTTKEGHVLWSEHEHMNNITTAENEKTKLAAIRYAKLIEHGQFQQTGDNAGILYPLENGETGMWQLIKSDTGIWQSSFLPVQ